MTASRPVDVVLFTDTAGFGGAERALLALAARLDRARWAPVLYHHADGETGPLLEGADAVGLPRVAVPRMPDGLVGAKELPSFVAHLRSRRPGVFHAHLTWPLACKFGLVAAIVARVPATVATVQLFPPFTPTAPTRAQYRYLGRAVGRYVAVSRDVAVKLCRAFGWNGERIEVLHNGVDLERFAIAPEDGLRAELSRGGTQRVVLVPTRLDPQKGLPFLVEAACRVEGAHFVVAGEGPERRRLDSAIRKAGIADRISLLGYRADVPELVAASDLVVLPSLYEGLPLVVVEAMAGSRPVVATAVGGTDEAVVDGETGLLVPAADEGALASAITRLLEDPALARRFGEAGRRRAEAAFSDGAVAARVEEIYDELLEARRRG
jgi:glycosyltransferase involved in cell wall biosynthesis